MPFGLKNASITFQVYIEDIIEDDYLGKFVVIYLDDILIFSDTLEQHIKHIKIVI
jgi:hypothetical protein